MVIRFRPNLSFFSPPVQHQKIIAYVLRGKFLRPVYRLDVTITCSTVHNIHLTDDN